MRVSAGHLLGWMGVDERSLELLPEAHRPRPQAFGRAAASVSEHFSHLVNWKELTGWVGAGCGSSPFPMAKAAFPGHRA